MKTENNYIIKLRNGEEHKYSALGLADTLLKYYDKHFKFKYSKGYDIVEIYKTEYKCMYKRQEYTIKEIEEKFGVKVISN